MAALTAPRFITNRLDKDAFPPLLKAPLKANVKVWAGGMAAIDATGFFLPATGASGQTVMGVFEQSADNTGGANGDKAVEVRRGSFTMNNSASGDLITQAHVSKTVYVVDDNTVAATDGSGTRGAAGKVTQLEPEGVVVQLGLFV